MIMDENKAFGYATYSDHEWQMDGEYDWRRIVERDRDRENWSRIFEQKAVNFIAAVPDSSAMLAHELDLRSAEWVPDLLAAITLEDIGATVREAPAPVVDIAQRLDLEHADWIGVPDPKADPFSFADDPAHVDGFAAVQARIQDEAQRQCAVTLTDPQARAVMQYAHGVQLSAAQTREWPITSPPGILIGDWVEHEHDRRVDAITEAQTMQRHADPHTAIDAAALAREVRELTPDYPRPPSSPDRGPGAVSTTAEPTALVPQAEHVRHTPEAATTYTHHVDDLPDLDVTKLHSHWSAESEHHLSTGHQMWLQREFHHRGPSL